MFGLNPLQMLLMWHRERTVAHLGILGFEFSFAKAILFAPYFSSPLIIEILPEFVAGS